MPYADPAQQAEYQREWIARRRAAWFADKACAWCGETDDLELDHENAQAKVDHRVWSWSRSRREAELAKCQVLCHTCHKIKTELVGENHPERGRYRHGTRAMYRRHGCKCTICLAGHAARLRAWRARRKAPLE